MLKKKFPSLASIGSDGNTTFLRAARAGHLDKVLEQLKNNVDINTSNANGLNALHLASKDGHINVVSELLKRGAKVDSATKKGNTALHIASLAGQEEVVKHLVEHGACVNVQSQNGFTPLYMAAQENHDAVVRFLLANGANQSLATEDGFTPLAVAMQQGHDKVVAVLLENDTRGKVRLPALHIAAKKDDCKAAALLLQNEHNPDVTSKSGFTPLHIASHYGNEAIASLLLSKGADVNYAAKHNITPLHVAAKWGKANMVSVLLSRGANIEAKTRDGLTPLHCAARSGHEQVVDMLLERGAPISAKTKNGLAALHMSSQGDHVDAARILLYHRAPVDDVTVDYLTALHVAAHCGHVGVARLLLDRKADPNARALNGFTPLHIACKKNRIKVVELLLKHGASIEATTESGLTPLHVASFMGCMNIVIYLVQNEAGPDVKTVRGETPLHLAARANQTDIIRILLRNGAQVDARAREQQTPLHIASRLGNVDIVMLLLQHGASVDSTTKDLYTALHIAAKEGQDEVASVLLENGASLEATTKKGFTPLHLAAKYGHMNVAKLLLRRDAPVDAQGKNGVTPLHVASHYDHQNVALLLLEKGASPHATAKNGHTPLHIAARKNQMDIATTLLEYGAKANSESKAGFTPLHLSAQEGHCDMSNLLIEHQADVNHKAKNGLTPLHLCSQEDRVEVGSILLKNESDVNSTTKAGYTPLHVACHFGQMGMVRLLLANGASVTPTTAVNYTPLHQAAQQGHSVIVNELLAAGADPNATTNQGQTAMSIAQKLGYISVMETLKGVTEAPISPTSADEKYKVVSPETMQETFMSDSEDEGGEDTMLSEQPYHYLTVDEMKGLGDDSLPIDVTRDERDNRDMDDTISPQHMKESYTTFAAAAADNVDINRHPLHVGFLVSFLVDARGGAMRGVRHSGVRVIVPPRRASMPLRVTCRYLKRDKLPHPPPLMEGEALASRILELGPVGAKFLGPVMIEVPHFGSLRGNEREIVILRSDNGETWREHTFEASEEAVHDVLSSSFEKDELSQYEESPRMTRILTTEFPHYIAVVSRVRQEVHAIGPEGGMVSSTVVPQVQAVFPHGALTKKIKVGLQAQPIPAELTAKLLGNRVAVSPIVTVEPRRRKFHKPISLTIPVPQAANKGMINQYSGDAPTLRLLCSITGGTTRAQWEDVTGSTPLTFVNDCVSFTTTVSARFWLMDCRNITEATKMATELYKEAIHVPFMAKFVVFAKRVDTTEARLRVFCMTDDKEDKTLEHQEHFTEVAKSRDVEVLEGKTQYLEFAGNLVPVTKSGEQLQLGFRAFKENRLPFTVRVKDPHADAIGRTIFMREAKVAKGDVPQQPICILNIVLPEEIIPEPDLPEHEAHKHSYITHTSGLQRLSDVSNLLGEDWVRLAGELGVSTSEVNSIKTELCESSVAHQGLAMLRLWLQNAGNKASASALEQGLRNIGRDDIIQQTVFQTGTYALSEELSPSYTTKQGVFKRIPGEKRDIIEERRIEERIPKDEGRDVSIGEMTPQIEERIPKKEERRMTIDKDDGDEKKYVAEEKAVAEESFKSVSETKKEIEKRLSQDVEDKATKEKVITRETKITTKESKTSKETIVTKETTSTKETSSKDVKMETSSKDVKVETSSKDVKVETSSKDVKIETSSKDVKTETSKKLLDDTTEKETAEEKAVSPEPAHLSFDEKRKSFEMGITPKEKIKQQDSLTGAVKPQEAVTAAFIAEESRVSVQEVKEETKTEEKEEEEEKELSFAEKRRSFEQGLSMKQPGDKLPAAERKKEAATDRKAEEEKRVSDFRRDSELFQEVSQGLDNIEKGIVKPAAQELLSPGVARTPPPSPADFTKDAPDNKKWSVETASNLLSGEDDKPRRADKSKEAVESSWLSRQDQVTEDVKKTSIEEKKSKEQKPKEKGKRDDGKKEPTRKNEKPSLDRKDSTTRVSPDKTPEPSKKVSPVKTDKKPLERRDSKKTPSPEKSVLIVKEKTTVTKVKSTEESTTAPTEKVSIKSQKSHEKADEKLIEIDRSRQKSTEKSKVESTKKQTTVAEKITETKEDKIKVEEKITKQVPAPAKGPAAEKKSTILGKTIETIKKPFQDKGGDKGAAKEEKGKSKGKGKGKQKSIDSVKSPSQDSDEPIQEQLSNVEDETKTITDSIEHKTVEYNKEITSESSKAIQEPVLEKNIVEKTVEIISKLSDVGKGVQPNNKSNEKGKGKGKISEPPKVVSLSKAASQEQGKSIKVSEDGKTALKDNGNGKNEGSPRETKGKGKGKEKSDSPKAEQIEEGAAKGEKTVVKQPSAQIDKTSEDKKIGVDKGITKDANGKGKGKGKMEQVKQQSADRVSVVEPLIEKTVQDITVISVGSVDNEIEEKAKKDDTGSPKDDKNKGKGKDKGKGKSGPAKTPSLEESDKPQKSDTTVVGKAVEMIKKPFQDQTKPVEDTKATQKPGKGKKQKSIESPKSPSLDKDGTAQEQPELVSQSKSVEKTVKPGNEGSDKKVEKPSVKDDKTKGKGKGKQKSIESNKSPSPDKDKIVQNEPKVESTPKDQNKQQKLPEPTKSEDKKKGKGKQKSIELSKTPSLEKEEDSLQVSTPEATLIEKTLETIKRPFQGKKDDKPVSKQGQEAEGKKGKGKSKQKSVESVRQSSTEQEPKEETIITTETVRLIKVLSQDKSGQVIEGSAIDLVTKPFGDKPPLIKSTESASPTEGSTRTATLIKELSQDKSGQQIEEKAIELVSKPFEHKDSKTLLPEKKITTVTLTKELSQEKSGQAINEKEVYLASQPLQEALGTQKLSKDAPPSEKETTSTSTLIKKLSLDKSGQVIGEKSIEVVSEPSEQKIITTTVVTLTRDLSHSESGHAIVEKEIDLVSKPLQEILSTHKEGITKAEPLITELSREKSGFIIEERPIDLVSQPFQDVLEMPIATVPLPSVDTTILSKPQDEERISITGPLIKELSQEKSGFIIGERPIESVSQPFQDILPSASHSSLSKDEITGSTKLMKKLSQEKSGQIEDKPTDLMAKNIQDDLSKLQGQEKPPSTGPLIKELSHEKSGFVIEERPIDLVSQPFQDILASAPHSSSSKEEITGSTMIIKKLSHDKIDQVIEEKSIDLLPKPLQDTLSKALGEKETRSTGPLVKELSLEKSGFIIEERPIDLVSQPFQNILTSAQHSSPSKDEITGSAKLIKKLPHDKSGQIVEEKPTDKVSKPLQGSLSKLQGQEKTPSAGPLIKELSHEKSGFMIEERPIDLVSQPFQDILTSAEHSSSSKDEITGSTKLKKKLPHDKIGQVIEEKPDLVSRPLKDTLLTTQGEEETPITGPLIKELSHGKSGFIIEETPIDLVSQPFQDKLTSAQHSSSSKGEITGSTRLIKKLPQDKSGQIEKKPTDLVSKQLQDSLSKPQGQEKTPSTGPLIKELSHEKSGFIIEERPIDLVSQPFQDILTSAEHSSSSKDEITGSTKLKKKLSHEKSGQIEEKPTDLVSRQLQDSLSKPQGQGKTPSTGPLIKELSHEKSGFVIEERPIDLVSKPFQGILETSKSTELRPSGKEGSTSAVMVLEEQSQDTGRLEGTAFDSGSKSFEDTTELPPSSKEGSTRAVSLMKELSQDKSGQVIEEGAIDLVAQPFLGSIGRKEDGTKLKKKESKPKTGDESTAKKNDFEHIQKTIDDAKIQFDQFVGIVSDKAAKSSSDETNEKESNSNTTITTTTTTSFDIEGGEILKSDEQEVEIPVEKEEDLLRIQKTIQHGFQNIPSGKIGTIDVSTVTTTITKPFEQGAGNVSIQAEKVIGAIDKDLEKVTENVSKSIGEKVTIVEKTIETQVEPVKDASATLVEKTIATVQENLPKIDYSFLNFGKITHESETLTDKGKDLPEVRETGQQELQSLPSEKIVTTNVTTITKTVTKPIEQGAENIYIQAEKIVGAIDKDEKKVKESIKRSVDGGVTVIEKTIESQFKPVKDASATLVEKTIVTIQQPLDDAFKGLGKMAHETVETTGKSLILTKGEVKDIGQILETAGQEAVGKVTHRLKTQESEQQSDFESESFPPEFRAQSVKIATFETVETIPPPGTAKDGKTSILSDVTVTSSSSDEIGRIIKEMESQLLSTKFGLDESTVDEGSEVESEDYTRESRTMPTTPMPVRKMLGDTEPVSDSEGVSKPYVTTPTLSRRVIGVGGSQRLTQDERPVVRVITEYVGDLSESEPEEDTYTVLEPEVKERRKFKIRFSPDMYGSEDKDDIEELQRPDAETVCSSSEALKKSDSIKSEKNIKRIERKFERMTSQTKEADPSMSEVTDGEFQRMVSQLSLEEMDLALHQWDAGGLTPSEVDSKDLTLSSDDTTSPLQQGLTDIFRPKLSSILPTSIYIEKTGTEVGSSGLTESSKMKLSLVKDSVPQIFQSTETDSQVRGDSIKTEQEQKQTMEIHRRERDDESQEGAYGFSESKTKGTKK